MQNKFMHLEFQEDVVGNCYASYCAWNSQLDSLLLHLTHPLGHSRGAVC